MRFRCQNVLMSSRPDPKGNVHRPRPTGGTPAVRHFCEKSHVKVQSVLPLSPKNMVAGRITVPNQTHQVLDLERSSVHLYNNWKTQDSYLLKLAAWLNQKAVKRLNSSTVVSSPLQVKNSSMKSHTAFDLKSKKHILDSTNTEWK